MNGVLLNILVSKSSILELNSLRRKEVGYNIEHKVELFCFSSFILSIKQSLHLILYTQNKIKKISNFSNHYFHNPY